MSADYNELIAEAREHGAMSMGSSTCDKLADAVESLQRERATLIEVLMHQQQTLTDIREHVRLYNGKPFLPKDVETRIASIHAQPWYKS